MQAFSRSHEWRATSSSSCRLRDDSKRSTAIAVVRRDEWGAKRVVLQGGTGADGSWGGCKRTAGTRTSSGKSKETVDQIRSFLRRVKLYLGALCRDKACKRARSRSFRVETWRPLACPLLWPAARRRRYKNIPLLRAFVVSLIREHSWHESLPLKGRSQICLENHVVLPRS